MKRNLTGGALASPSQVAPGRSRATPPRPILSTAYKQTLEVLMLLNMKINERGVSA